MTIEAYLERIATALERLSAGAMIDAAVEASLPEKRGPGRPRKVEAAPDPEVAAPDIMEDSIEDEPTSPPLPTKEDVRAALVAYQTRSSADKARALLKSVGGADTLGSLKEEKFAAVIEAAKKAK